MEQKLLNDASLLTDYAAKEIVKQAGKIECECPKHLVAILNQIREFQAYEQKCANASAKDKAVHEWLLNAAINLDQMLSSTIVQLARMEGMVDDENQIIPHPSLGPK